MKIREKIKFLLNAMYSIHLITAIGWIDHYRQNYRPYRPVAMVVHLYVYPYKTISQRGLPKELVAAWLDCQSWYAHDIRPILVMRRDAPSASAQAA